MEAVPPHEDGELIRASLAGDRQAFGRIVERCGPLVLFFWLPDRHRPEDPHP